jgi:hypothetical protein
MSVDEVDYDYKQALVRLIVYKVFNGENFLYLQYTEIILVIRSNVAHIVSGNIILLRAQKDSYLKYCVGV